MENLDNSVNKNVILTIIEAYFDEEITREQLIKGLKSRWPEYADSVSKIPEFKVGLFTDLVINIVRKEDIQTAISFTSEYLKGNEDEESKLAAWSSEMTDKKIEHIFVAVMDKSDQSCRLFMGDYGNPFILAMMIKTILEQYPEVKQMFNKINNLEED